VTQIDPDLLPQALPDGWMPGSGKHLGAMVVTFAPPDHYLPERSPHFHPTAGRLLMDALFAAEVEELGDIYWTALVKVPLGENSSGALHIEAALPYLVEEVQHVVPLYVLALGQKVFSALTGSVLGLALYRGLWQHLDERFDWEEALVMPTFSPAEVLDRPSLKAAFDRDVREFASAWRKGRGDG